MDVEVIENTIRAKDEQIPFLHAKRVHLSIVRGVQLRTCCAALHGANQLVLPLPQQLRIVSRLRQPCQLIWTIESVLLLARPRHAAERPCLRRPASRRGAALRLRGPCGRVGRGGRGRRLGRRRLLLPVDPSNRLPPPQLNQGGVANVCHSELARSPWRLAQSGHQCSGRTERGRDVVASPQGMAGTFPRQARGARRPQLPNALSAAGHELVREVAGVEAEFPLPLADAIRDA
mmetsp:Transcript_42589/g.121904  ORF Transcript_42589/g.121904 Transcript_42589/m.121904 type:complete len:233 (-) Transcript_42589:998-1696(-)